MNGKIQSLSQKYFNFETDEPNLHSSQETMMSLQQLLAIQENKLQNQKLCEQNNVRISYKEPQTNIDGDIDTIENHDEETQYKIFNIKSLKVTWEGNNNSYMHVFVDTTDIRRLEQAHNNIRCQKIMFASASHEFRTPLNAILNSYKFIESSFKSIQTKIDMAK